MRFVGLEPSFNRTCMSAMLQQKQEEDESDGCRAGAQQDRQHFVVALCKHFPPCVAPGRPPAHTFFSKPNIHNRTGPITSAMHRKGLLIIFCLFCLQQFCAVLDSVEGDATDLAPADHAKVRLWYCAGFIFSFRVGR